MRDIPVATRLLIADSDKVIIDVYRRFFKAMGYDVQTAVGGVDCVELLRNYSPHILVLDMELPWGGGEGVLERMRDDARIKPRAMVLVSSGDHPRFDTCLNAFDGPLQWLRKPFRLQTLHNTVRNMQAASADFEDGKAWAPRLN